MKPDDLVPASAERDALAAEAFRPLLLAAAWRLAVAVRETLDAATLGERFAFLGDYENAFAGEEHTPLPHPLRDLAALAGWPASATELWLIHGLVEEDARFGPVFAALDPESGEARPSQALMQSWWGTLPREGLRPALRALVELGLLRPCGGATRNETFYEVEENCWSAARGEAPANARPGLRLQPPEAARPLAALWLPDELRRQVAELAPRLARPGGSLIVRGPEHNGRGSLLAALAAEEGRQALFIDWPLADGEAPAWLGAFCTLANARPILRLKATPGERLRLPRLAGYGGWLGIVCGDEDAIEAPPAPSHCLHIPLPDAALRARMLQAARPERDATENAALAGLLHLASGHLLGALQAVDVAAETPAAQAARLRQVALAGGSAELDSLARRLDTRGAEWQALVLDGELQRELHLLEARCRQRDRLRETLPAAFASRLNAGVRALFAGPSGTGKTFAAQVLAERLGVPLYRLDLSSVVSKYIGETERNLHRLLAAAEALDVMLLLDEGDALLARRTAVGNAHDRYANLETNFLLQRLETHRGLVLITTNALERIDTAFLRRFDLLLNFRPPEAEERRQLWLAHLPPTHAVSPAALERIAEACSLSGGQIRNVVLAATSTALALDCLLDDVLLFEALRREYRRSDSLFPLAH